MAIDGVKVSNLISRGFKNISSQEPMLKKGWQVFEKTLGKTGTNVEYAFNDLGNCVKKTVRIGNGNSLRAQTGLSTIVHGRMDGEPMYSVIMTGKEHSLADIVNWYANAKKAAYNFFNINALKNNSSREQIVKLFQMAESGKLG